MAFVCISFGKRGLGSGQRSLAILIVLRGVKDLENLAHNLAVAPAVVLKEHLDVAQLVKVKVTLLLEAVGLELELGNFGLESLDLAAQLVVVLVGALQVGVERLDLLGGGWVRSRFVHGSVILLGRDWRARLCRGARRGPASARRSGAACGRRACSRARTPCGWRVLADALAAVATLDRIVVLHYARIVVVVEPLEPLHEFKVVLVSRANELVHLNGAIHFELGKDALQNLVVVHKLIIGLGTPVDLRHGDLAREQAVHHLAGDRPGGGLLDLAEVEVQQLV
mmetsp:Transcript_5080/g.13038  ORF Transcript_5080/g.13038 Transcript_5080/m.13038 type:complete len:282 (-) Transcript_5080:122-967(-)